MDVQKSSYICIYIELSIHKINEVFQYTHLSRKLSGQKSNLGIFSVL